jgi:hypothetical protein
MPEGTELDRDTVSLRPVADADIALFDDHQRDPVSAHMAGFSARTLQEHERHWQRIRHGTDNVTRTVMWNTTVVGNIGS